MSNDVLTKHDMPENTWDWAKKYFTANPACTHMMVITGDYEEGGEVKSGGCWVMPSWNESYGGMVKGYVLREDVIG